MGAETKLFTDASSAGALDGLKPSAASESCGCAIMAPRVGALAGTAGTAGSPLGAAMGAADGATADGPTGEADATGATDAVRTLAEGGTAALPTGALAG